MQNKFYTVQDLITNQKTDLSRRMLMYRLHQHLDNGTIVVGEFIFKLGYYWQIHESLIHHFQRKGKPIK